MIINLVEIMMLNFNQNYKIVKQSKYKIKRDTIRHSKQK